MQHLPAPCSAPSRARYVEGPVCDRARPATGATCCRSARAHSWRARRCARCCCGTGRGACRPPGRASRRCGTPSSCSRTRCTRSPCLRWAGPALLVTYYRAFSCPRHGPQDTVLSPDWSVSSIISKACMRCSPGMASGPHPGARGAALKACFISNPQTFRQGERATPWCRAQLHVYVPSAAERTDARLFADGMRQGCISLTCLKSNPDPGAGRSCRCTCPAPRSAQTRACSRMACAPR